jgi:hypothetical protein
VFTGQGVHAEPTIRPSVQLSRESLAVCVCCLLQGVSAVVLSGFGCAHREDLLGAPLLHSMRPATQLA